MSTPGSRRVVWPFIVVAAGVILVASILYFHAHPLVQEVQRVDEPPATGAK